MGFARFVLGGIWGFRFGGSLGLNLHAWVSPLRLKAGCSAGNFGGLFMSYSGNIGGFDLGIVVKSVGNNSLVAILKHNPKNGWQKNKSI